MIFFIKSLLLHLSHNQSISMLFQYRFPVSDHALLPSLMHRAIYPNTSITSFATIFAISFNLCLCTSAMNENDANGVEELSTTKQRTSTEIIDTGVSAADVSGIGKEDEDDFEEDDDDFGSFDEASSEEFEPDQPLQTATDTSTSTIDFEYGNESEIDAKIASLLDEIVPLPASTAYSNTAGDSPSKLLLDERSGAIYEQLSRLPHLKPNNWIKSQIRHNLLIKLGLPINLDEIRTEKHTSFQASSTGTTFTSHARRRSVNEEDLHWEDFSIPEFADLGISDDTKDEKMNKTDEILSRIETDNLNNTSRSFLDSCSEDKLKEKLSQLQQNYQELLQLSSIWNHNFKDVKNNFEIYESVVQNLIGYSQKLERDQLLQEMRQVKNKKKKKSLWR